MGTDVGANFVAVFSAIFFFILGIALLVAPVVGGVVMFEWLSDERRFNTQSRVAQYSWLFTTMYWITLVLYYSLYIAIFVALVAGA